MANLGNAFVKAAEAFIDSFGPSEYSAGGKKIVCAQCGGTVFAEGSALLNTTGMTFINLDWADKSATTLACTKCGLVQWYLVKPERME